ncbi:sulfurtransferase TusA family protein [Sphingomonas sp. MS122]|uniref:sulfurtransferase TusA family protein n=1 Tax=Sphingomonas sp. MS122 TaxID=3412683 RepID=UPI003C2DD5CE
MRRIDARGLSCPWPALRLARALRQQGTPLEILADDPAAEREIRALAAALGAPVTAFAIDGSPAFRVG